MSSINIVCFGSPLVDMIVKVGKPFLAKYNLKAKDSVKMQRKHESIFKEIIQFKPVLQIGGSVTNTTRILRWLLTKHGSKISYFGSIGKDYYGTLVKKTFDLENIKYFMKEILHENTGKTAVLIAEINARCLVTDLGASKIFITEDYERDIDAVIREARYLYLSGFFMNVNQDVVDKLVNHFSDSKKEIFFNLGAPFIVENFKEEVLKLCSNAKIIFGNAYEYTALIQAVIGMKLTDFARQIREFDSILSSNTDRIFVMTRGRKSVYVFRCGIDEFSEIEFESLDGSQIKDANGAGDAFVGGFLAQYLVGQPLGECVNCGIFAAGEVLKNVGCNFNKDLRFVSRR